MQVKLRMPAFNTGMPAVSFSMPARDNGMPAVAKLAVFQVTPCVHACMHLLSGAASQAVCGMLKKSGMLRNLRFLLLLQ